MYLNSDDWTNLHLGMCDLWRQKVYGSGHQGAAVLLPGFAIIW